MENCIVSRKIFSKLLKTRKTKNPNEFFWGKFLQIEAQNI